MAGVAADLDWLTPIQIFHVRTAGTLAAYLLLDALKPIGGRLSGGSGSRNSTPMMLRSL